jgi:hypothetical protein
VPGLFLCPLPSFDGGLEQRRALLDPILQMSVQGADLGLGAHPLGDVVADRDERPLRQAEVRPLLDAGRPIFGEHAELPELAVRSADAREHVVTHRPVGVDEGQRIWGRRDLLPRPTQPFLALAIPEQAVSILVEGVDHHRRVLEDGAESLLAGPDLVLRRAPFTDHGCDDHHGDADDAEERLLHPDALFPGDVREGAESLQGAPDCAHSDREDRGHGADLPEAQRNPEEKRQNGVLERVAPHGPARLQAEDQNANGQQRHRRGQRLAHPSPIGTAAPRLVPGEQHRCDE